MDLTPKSLKKKKVRKRIRPPRIIQHWKNPFQVVILSVAAISFLGSIAVDRIVERRTCNKQLAQAEELRVSLEELNDQAAEVFIDLESIRAGLIVKAQSKKEAALDQQLSALNSEVETEFLEFSACYTAIPARYKSQYEIQQTFADFTRVCIESALDRQAYELARQFYNDTELYEYLDDIKSTIKGDGQLEIVSPGGVREVIIWSLKSDGPRLVVSDHIGRSSTFPYVLPEIEKGSYLMFVTRTDSALVPYPVFISHGESKTLELELSPAIPEGMIFIPGGEFIYGGEGSTLYRKHQRSLPSFFIGKYEVTFAEYIVFWKSLSDSTAKQQMMSRVQFTETDAAADAWNAAGVLTDERLKLENPVVGISHDAAQAFCAWKSGQTGQLIRLPTAFEWEKAARGVDGRTYPWGYEFEPDARLALTADNLQGKEKYPLWAPPGRFLRGSSVYNSCDMAGNVSEMTSSLFPDSQTRYQIKGGSAFTPTVPCSFSIDAASIPSDVGFRYVQEIVK